MSTFHGTPERHDDDGFERQVRAMLRRRSHDVQPDQPSWDELLQRSEGVVVSLHTGRPLGDAAHLRRKPQRSWLRPLLAAAASLAIAMSAGIVIGRTSDGDEPASPAGQPDHEADDSETLEAFDFWAPLPAAGEGNFRVPDAPMLFPETDEASLLAQIAEADEALNAELERLQDPIGVTRDYLESRHIIDPASPYEVWTDEPPDSRRMEDGVRDGVGVSMETVRIWWSVRDPDAPGGVGGTSSIVSIGPVYLRNLAGPPKTGPDVWVVVGAWTQDLWLSGVERDGGIVRFNVFDSKALQLPVQVLVNGVLVEEGGFADPEGPIEVPVPDDQPVTIRVQHVGTTTPVSLVETAFVPRILQATAPTTTAPPSTTAAR